VHGPSRRTAPETPGVSVKEVARSRRRGTANRRTYSQLWKCRHDRILPPRAPTIRHRLPAAGFPSTHGREISRGCCAVGPRLLRDGPPRDRAQARSTTLPRALPAATRGQLGIGVAEADKPNQSRERSAWTPAAQGLYYY